ILLHYVSRDTVELLANGDNGLPRLRDALAAYDQKKPLFGYVNYRSRRFILKFVPEGTSRLLLGELP
ncbi:hypothetical protein KEM52_002536, partial [Ascosphaera acerosa]